MNLSQVIHQRWAAAENLNSLLAVDRVSTGMSLEETLPFAVISKESDRPLRYCNEGSTVAQIALRIQVFHNDYDAAAAIVEQVKTVFDQTSFPLAGDDKVIDMRCANDFEHQEPDGVWRMVVDFHCTVYLAAGASS